jgi:CheY-like chemotaxis protein
MALILVIDDEEGMRSLVRRILATAHHSVLEAGDGASALRLLETELPAVVISDIFMPSAEGIETIREIRRRQPKARIIAMSGGSVSSNEPVLLVAHHMGAHAILPKPFRANELLETVTRVLAIP